MGDKCQAHDSCMKEIRDDLNVIKDMLRNGHVIHAEFKLRFQMMEAQQALLEEKINNQTGGWGWKPAVFRFGLDLIGKAILVILAMALYGYHAKLGV